MELAGYQRHTNCGCSVLLRHFAKKQTEGSRRENNERASLSGRLISTLVLSYARRLLPVKTQKGSEAGEASCRRSVLLKDKNPSGELVLTRRRKAERCGERREVKVARYIKSDFGGKPWLLSK